VQATDEDERSRYRNCHAVTPVELFVAVNGEDQGEKMTNLEHTIALLKKHFPKDEDAAWRAAFCAAIQDHCVHKAQTALLSHVARDAEERDGTTWQIPEYDPEAASRELLTIQQLRAREEMMLRLDYVRLDPDDARAYRASRADEARRRQSGPELEFVPAGTVARLIKENASAVDDLVGAKDTEIEQLKQRIAELEREIRDTIHEASQEMRDVAAEAYWEGQAENEI
jgi:hypothetical protein